MPLIQAPAPMGASASGNRHTGFGPYTMPAAPAYSATMPAFPAMPETRPLEYLSRRRRPRWGLRFLFLLILAGTGAYFLKPYVPWIDAHMTPIEHVVRTQAAKYGLLPAPAPLTPAAPATAPAPVAAPALPPPVAPVAARPVTEPPGRPAAQAMAGRPARAVAAAPAGGTRAMRGGGGYYRRPSARLQATRARAAARRAYFVARARARAAAAAASSRAAAVSADASPSLADVDPDVPSADAPPPVAPRAKEPPPAAAAAAPAKVAAAPPEEDRSTNALVQSAARSGDELDRLMAGAVKSTPRAAPARGVSAEQREIDRQLANTQKSRAPAAAAANDAGITRQPLSRSDIQTVMKDVQKSVRDCFRQHGKGGVADVKIDVAPEGNVIGTIIRGDLAGTPSGSCVESKLKAATFPPSTGLRFDYRLLVK